MWSEALLSVLTGLDTRLGEPLLNLDATHQSVFLLSSALDHLDPTHQQPLFSGGQALLSHKPLSEGAGARSTQLLGALGGEGGLCAYFCFYFPISDVPKGGKRKGPFPFQILTYLNSVTAGKRLGQTERYRYYRPNISLCGFSNIQLPQQPLHITSQA